MNTTETTDTPPQPPAVGAPLDRGVRPDAQPVAWMGGDGHPRHLNAVQTATDRRIYGKWTPLYDEQALRAVQLDERERWATLLSGARRIAESNIKRADDCGMLSRALVDALKVLRA